MTINPKRCSVLSSNYFIKLGQKKTHNNNELKFLAHHQIQILFAKF